MSDEERDKLDEIQARAANATPGPWKVWAMEVLADPVGDSNLDTALPIARTTDPHRGLRTFNADFIAAARSDVPALVAEVRSLRGVVQAVEALAEKWGNGDEVSEWNPLDELRAALGDTRSEPRDEHWWAAKALMAICDNATTWQSDSGDLYRPLLVGVTEASHVVGRMVVAALAAAADAPQPSDDDEGIAHVAETYRQTINGREQLGWQCVTCGAHQIVEGGPGMGKPVPAADLALLERLAAEHVRETLAGPSPAVLPERKEQRCEHDWDFYRRATTCRRCGAEYGAIYLPSPPVSGVAGNPEGSAE